MDENYGRDERCGGRKKKPGSMDEQMRKGKNKYIITQKRNTNEEV